MHALKTLHRVNRDAEYHIKLVNIRRKYERLLGAPSPTIRRKAGEGIARISRELERRSA